MIFCTNAMRRNGNDGSHGFRRQATTSSRFELRIYFVLAALTRKRSSRHRRTSFMKHYRAYAARLDGNFEGYKSLNCADDDDAGKGRVAYRK